MTNKVITAVAWEFLGSISGQGLNFIISIILARLLSPAEFGLVAMAFVFIAILNSFADLGFGMALIQKKENSTVTYSSVFFINIITGLFIVLFLQLTAPIIGNFYENTEVTTLIRLLSILVIINSFSIVQNALFSRNLDFKSLNIRLMLSISIGGVFGIIAAFKGYGVYSLVIQQLTAGIVSLITIWSLSKWRPQLEFSQTSIKELLDFSAYTFLNTISQELTKRMDVLVIGKLFSATTLGFYGRAESLVDIVRVLSTQSLNRVFFPVMSKLQDNNQEFKKAFFKIFDLVLFSTFFISGIMVLSGEYIIITLLGEKWRPSIIIFQILMLKIFAYPVNSFLILSLISKGLAKENFIHSLIRKIIYLSSFVIAYIYGFNMFLYTLVIVSLIGTIYNIFVNSKYLNISFYYQLKQLLLFGLTFAIVAFMVNSINMNTHHQLINVIVKLITYTFLYVFFIYICNKKIMLKIYTDIQSIYYSYKKN